MPWDTAAHGRRGAAVASDQYEEAEDVFLSAVRSDTDRMTLTGAARKVANAASAFNAEAYRRLHTGVEDAWIPLDQLTERTERSSGVVG